MVKVMVGKKNLGRGVERLRQPISGSQRGAGMAGDKWSVVGDGVLATEGEKAKSWALSSSEGLAMRVCV